MLLSLSLRYAENANANVEPRDCSGLLGQRSTRIGQGTTSNVMLLISQLTAISCKAYQGRSDVTTLHVPITYSARYRRRIQSSRLTQRPPPIKNSASSMTR